jgi:hypothetical protein
MTTQIFFGSHHRALAAALAIIALCTGATSAAVPASYKPNRVAIEYVEPANPAHRHLYAQLKERHLLERFRGFLSPMRLPVTLHLKTAGCDGESNAWYEEEHHTVTVCYEYLADVLRNAPDMTTATGVTPQEAVFGPTLEVVFHEVGHALFHLLQVPIFGREEDAADQLANILMVNLDPDVARQAVKGVAFMYANESKGQTPSGEAFANVHGLPAQRFYNVMCLAYGKDAKLFGDLVEKGYLPESRAEDCEGEYKQVDYAFEKLIRPYIDEKVRARVEPKGLMRPGRVHFPTGLATH